MPSDYSVFWPAIFFLPLFLWIMFMGPRKTLTPAQRRRALVIASVGIVVGTVVGAVGLFYLVTPAPVAVVAAAPRREAPPATAVAPPARVIHPR
jgi:hypothetical protein